MPSLSATTPGNDVTAYTSLSLNTSFTAVSARRGFHAARASSPLVVSTCSFTTVRHTPVASSTTATADSIAMYRSRVHGWNATEYGRNSTASSALEWFCIAAKKPSKPKLGRPAMRRCENDGAV